MTYHLAQINIGRIAAPLESDRMADFVDNLDLVNGAGEDAPGFVWRLVDDDGAATSYSVFGDPELIPNMTVWENLDALRAFVYDKLHASFLRRRREWFVPQDQAVTVCWWIPAGHLPTLVEAEERLIRYRAAGATPHAFGLRDTDVAAAALQSLVAGVSSS